MLVYSTCYMCSAVDYVSRGTFYLYNHVGRGEAIRTLLVDNNVEYEEVDVGDNWVNGWKPKMVSLYTQQIHSDTKSLVCTLNKYILNH